jgi:high-affinity iron transporter
VREPLDLHRIFADHRDMGTRNLVAGSLATLVLVVAAAPPSSTDLLQSGKTLFEKICAACHGVTGEGNGPVAFSLKSPPRNFTKDPFKAGDSVEQIFSTVTNGLPDTYMYGYPMLPEYDRWGVAYYVRGFRPTK